ncbi:MAG: hypothetical protein COA82_01965 [Alkaliphilus sp.]|nr:hypothetical protein [bacterium AH-315-G05]MBN4069563.1 hypothetical protein [bacterium AH-315-G05]PHS36068.1 MAG: hypothetical protein COA82_01965 [Alkaliphilus sp.]
MLVKVSTIVVIAIILISTNSYATNEIEESDESRAVESYRKLDGAEIKTEAASDTSYSKTNDEIDNNDLFVIVGPIFPVVINAESLVLQITAPVGTTLKIELYANISLIVKEENYVAKHDPIHLEVGLLERVWHEIKLRRGNNKIVISAICKDGNMHRETRMVYVKKVENMKELLEKNKSDDVFFAIAK